VACFPGEALLPFFFDFFVFVIAPRGAMLTGFG
jgi:hypothetical protein